VPRVVDATPLKVSRELYNTIRSFVESSTKDTYPHNTGVHHGDVVIFEKKGKWRLIVKVNEVELRRGILYTRLVMGAGRYKLEVSDYGGTVAIEFSSDNPSEIKSVVVVPSEPVPYSIPIPAEHLADKMMIYHFSVVEHISSSECKYSKTE
jgi:hypothetical protein